MIPHTFTSSTEKRQGFTLIELLAVVGIIAILLGLVLSAIDTVHRYSRKAIAKTEVRAIEDAWKRYFDHYNKWPDVDYYLGGSLSQKDVYHTFRMDATVGAALEGRIDDDERAREINPHGIHFIDFTRYGEQGGEKTPVNPWYRGEELKKSDGDSDSDLENRNSRYFYYVRFDINANNLTSTSGIPDLNKNISDKEDGTDKEDSSISRSVIVWTYNPDAPDEGIIASWRR